MNKLFKITALISVNKEGRTWPIKTGYRPGFNFVDKKQTSGSIKLIDREQLNPGESSIVEISFVSNLLLGNITPGVKFKFYEGPIEIGTGDIISIEGWV